MRNAYFIPNIQYKTMKKIDPLRVSQSISKNMMKDLNNESYRAGDQKAMDIKLANRDQEILLGPDNDGEGTAADPDKEESKRVEKDTLQTIERNEVVDVKDTKEDGAIMQKN